MEAAGKDESVQPRVDRTGFRQHARSIAGNGNEEMQDRGTGQPADEDAEAHTHVADDKLEGRGDGPCDADLAEHACEAWCDRLVGKHAVVDHSQHDQQGTADEDLAPEHPARVAAVDPRVHGERDGHS